MNINKNYVIYSQIFGLSTTERGNYYQLLIDDINQNGLDLSAITTSGSSSQTPTPQAQEGPQVIFTNPVQQTGSSQANMDQPNVGVNLENIDIFQGPSVVEQTTPQPTEQTRVQERTTEIIDALKNFALRQNTQRASARAATATGRNRGNNR